jgi:hypothetical protein
MPSPAVYKERRAVGLCPLCGSSPDDKYIICSSCRTKERASLRDRRVKMRSEGKCGSCCYPLDSSSHQELCVNYKIGRRRRSISDGMCGRCRHQRRTELSSMCHGCLTGFRARRADLRKKVLDHYGTACACCGETQSEFLQIDHIDGGGTKHRKTTRDICKWLVAEGFPDGFKTLCSNCNVGKYINGGICPKLEHVGRIGAASSQWSRRPLVNSNNLTEDL